MIGRPKRADLARLGAGAALLVAASGIAAFLSVPSDEPAPIGAPVAQAVGDAVKSALSRGKPVVAEFGSVSCSSCREMKVILTELQRTHGEKLTVVDIDALKERQYLARYRIQLLPTQVFFDAQGREIGRHMGKISGNDIIARLGEAIR